MQQQQCYFSSVSSSLYHRPTVYIIMILTTFCIKGFLAGRWLSG